MTRTRAILWCLGLTAAAAAFSLALAGSLPEVVPTHWDLHGRPDAYGPKWVSLWLMPLLMLGMVGLFLLLPKISPKPFNVERFANTYHFLMVAVVGLFGAMHLAVLDATRTGHFSMTRLVPAVIFLFFVLFGNVAGRIRRNFWVGVRTPWTLADERVWDATHRAAGKLWFWGGLAGLVASLAGAPPAALFGFMVVIALWPVLHSFLIWRRAGDGPASA